jgi:predicted nucleic acid-binding protein
MRRVIISDTTILIIFNNIGEINILHELYGEILITPEVATEFIEPLPDWIKVEHVKDKKYQKIIETQLDLGEASAFALAAEFDNVLLLLDDLKARKLANVLKINITGTLGIISKSKQLGIIKALKPILEKITQSNFRISQNIIDEILRINNEI